jgi:hypothetical protein
MNCHRIDNITLIKEEIKGGAAIMVSFVAIGVALNNPAVASDSEMARCYALAIGEFLMREYPLTTSRWYPP